MATSSETLIPELAGYHTQFAGAREAYQSLIQGLDDEQFNWRPEDERWSIAECIDHLIMVGSLMNKNIDEGIAKAEHSGLKSNGPFSYGLLGNWFVRAAGGSPQARRRKLKAPSIYTPTSNHSLSRLNAAFDELQVEFIARLERANGLNLAKVKVPSPVTRLLRLSLGQWFALLAGHQERHLAQAQDVRERLGA